MDDRSTMLPPGPRAHPYLQGYKTLTNPTAFLDDCASRFGDAFTIRMPFGPPIVMVHHPDAVRAVFTGDEETMRGGEANGILGPLLGRHSILLLDGDAHERERRLLLPAFHGDRLRGYAPVIESVADELVERWPRGVPLRMQDEMQRITLDVILRIVFGVSAADEMGMLRTVLTRWLRASMNPVLLWPRLQVDCGRLSPWGRAQALRRRVEEYLRGAIAERREGRTANGDDVLSVLVEARDDAGCPMADEQIVDEMLTLLVAGHETTATSLAWVLYRLQIEPGLATRVAEDEQYLEATIKETLRLNPIIPDVGRRLARPMRIAGWDLPAGVAVAPGIYLTHRRPDVWADPLRFDPGRFIDHRPKPYEFFPFGGGVRRCLGMALAMMEMKIVLTSVLARADLRLAPGYRMKLIRRSITFAPSDGLPVIATSRGASAQSAA